MLHAQRNGAQTTSKRSAYFADSDDSSSNCGEPGPRREVVADRAPAPPAAGGRWVLERFRGQLPAAAAAERDRVGDRPNAVFYGSIRFPASRVALW